MSIQSVSHPDLTNEPIAVKTLYPDFSKSNSIEEQIEEKERIIEDRIENNPELVCVHDADCDGLSAAVVVKWYDPNVKLIPRHHTERISIGEVGRLLTDFIDSGKKVIIVDSGNDGDVSQYIDPYVEIFDEVVVYDHHQWSVESLEYLDKNGVDHVIDEKRCGAMITHDELLSNPEEWKTDFVSVVQDHDLWIKEDPRSDSLADFSTAASNSEYIEECFEHGLDVLYRKPTRSMIINERNRKQQKIGLALQRSEFYKTENVLLAITYGECPKSETGSILCGEYGADIACMMMPDGKLSFRSNNGYAIKMAREFNGGGHKNAAGGEIISDIKNSEEHSYEKYWGTMGHCFHEKLAQKAATVL